MNFSVYHLETGRIVLNAMALDEEGAAANAPEGYGWIEGHWGPESHYVYEGQVLPLPSSPGPWATFDPFVGVWYDARTPEQLAAEFEQRRAEALTRLLQLVNAARAPYITNVIGQEMIYLSKQLEAQAYLAEVAANSGVEEGIDLSAYPWLQREIGLTAPTAYQLAQLWLGMKALLNYVGPLIEEVRLTGQDALRAATTPEELEAALVAAHAALFP